jgi:hypothetical protein
MDRVEPMENKAGQDFRSLYESGCAVGSCDVLLLYSAVKLAYRSMTVKRIVY